MAMWNNCISIVHLYILIYLAFKCGIIARADVLLNLRFDLTDEFNIQKRKRWWPVGVM